MLALAVLFALPAGAGAQEEPPAEAPAEEAPAEEAAAPEEEAPQPPAPLGGRAPPRAEQLYQQAVEAWRTSRFEESARTFDEALKVYPTSAKLAKLSGQAWDKVGVASRAIRSYELYLELAPFPEDQEQIDAAIARLKPLALKQRAVVSVATRPPGAVVFVEGEQRRLLGTTPLETQMDPGSYILLTRMKGREPDRRTVIVETGKPLALDIEMTLPGAEAEVSERIDWRMPAGFGLIGAGAVGIAAGVYFGIKAADTQDRVEKLPAGERDDYDRLKSDHDSQSLGAGLGYGLGGACLAVGAGLIVWRALHPATGAEPAPPPSGAVTGAGASWQF